jgi:hypothetical protein
VHVEFQKAHAQLERGVEGGQRIFRKVARVAAVSHQMNQSFVVQRNILEDARLSLTGAQSSASA